MHDIHRQFLKYFVVTILALLLLEVEFACVEFARQRRGTSARIRQGWNPCTFAVAFERDKFWRNAGMLTSEDAKKVGGGKEFVI